MKVYSALMIYSELIEYVSTETVRLIAGHRWRRPRALDLDRLARCEVEHLAAHRGRRRRHEPCDSRSHVGRGRVRGQGAAETHHVSEPLEGRGDEVVPGLG